MHTNARTILRTRLTPSLLQLRQHELGVSVDDNCDSPSDIGAELRSWVNDWRSKGRGQVMPLSYVRGRAAGTWYGAFKQSQVREAQPRADRIICRALNDPRSGLLVEDMTHRCHTCGDC